MNTGIVGWATLALFAGSVWYGIWSILPPRPVGEEAPDREFSSARAMRHLRVIAAEPHPLGSAANAKVCEYLADELRRLGFQVEVQEAGHSPTRAPLQPDRNEPPIMMANIIARLPGRRPGPAVALACHYDSAPLAPGAGDDGAAVAAILETARAVQSGPRLENDLVILITDGEEAGFLGAREFVEKHPLARRIGVIFNYDGRGRCGPSILMETSAHNGCLIREFARVAPYRLGATLAYEAYKHLPNFTDMTAFRAHGLAGLNFCISNGLAFYHQPTDSLQNADEATIQQIGANALALARHFGNLDLTDLHEEDRIFFNPCGLFLLHYPKSLNQPLAIAVIAAVIAGIIFLVKRGDVGIGGLFAGIGASLVTAFCALAVVLAVSTGMLQGARHYAALVNGDLANGDLFLAGCSALAVAAGTACTALFRRQLSLASLGTGGLMIWLALTGAVCAVIPAGCYQFVWPLAWGSLGIFAAVIGRDHAGRSGRRRCIWIGLQWLAMVAVVVQFAPVIYLTGVTFGSAKVWMAAMPLGLVGLLLVPCWELISQARRWLLPAVSAAVAVALLALAR